MFRNLDKNGDGVLSQDEIPPRLRARLMQADTNWDAEFNAHILQMALGQCRPHFEAATWRAFELVWLENRPAMQVARELGQPIDWVYVAKSRVLGRLRQELAGLLD